MLVKPPFLSECVCARGKAQSCGDTAHDPFVNIRSGCWAYRPRTTAHKKNAPAGGRRAQHPESERGDRRSGRLADGRIGQAQTRTHTRNRPAGRAAGSNASAGRRTATASVCVTAGRVGRRRLTRRSAARRASTSVGSRHSGSAIGVAQVAAGEPDVGQHASSSSARRMASRRLRTRRANCFGARAERRQRTHQRGAGRDSKGGDRRHGTLLFVFGRKKRRRHPLGPPHRCAPTRNARPFP